MSTADTKREGTKRNHPIIQNIVILTQPPYQWLQRTVGQCFEIETREPFDSYKLDLMIFHASGTTPDTGEYYTVCPFQQYGNGLTCKKRSCPVRNSNTHLIVYPYVSICSRKKDRPFAFRLILSSGITVYSRAFYCHNRTSKKTLSGPMQYVC